MKLDDATCRRLFGSARVARLGTIGPNGPHLVPIVFALHGNTIVHAVDQKPKSSRHLQRLRNVTGDPRVAVLADAYDDDWSQLWWVRADGTASVSSADIDLTDAQRMLADRYRQYVTTPPQGPVVAISIGRWTGWAASEAALRPPGST